MASVLSHLLQMRGLKPLALTGMLNKMESHLLQMRGLKQKSTATSAGAK